MTASQLTVSYQEAVAVVSIVRPPVNAFDGELLAQLASALDTCATDGSVRVIVIASGLPGVFSAGADLRWLRTLDTAGCSEFIRRGH